MLKKLLFAVMIFSTLTIAEEIQITAAKDNSIFSDDTLASNGAGEYLFVGRTNHSGLRRALIYFNVADAIPAGATIESVSLSLNMNKTKGGSFNLGIHTLNADWGEGSSDNGSREGGGAPATKNDATWTQSFFDSLSWANPGADFNATADATISVGATALYTWGSNAAMVSTVQNWLDNPASNFGWLVKGNESTDQSTKRFESRESTTKPTLTITYSSVTAIAVNKSKRADRFLLSENYPNPFNPSTKIDITVPSANRESFKLEIFNITGQLVRKLFSGTLPSGNYTF